jgi:hypothetical protein
LSDCCIGRTRGSASSPAADNNGTDVCPNSKQCQFSGDTRSSDLQTKCGWRQTIDAQFAIALTEVSIWNRQSRNCKRTTSNPQKTLSTSLSTRRICKIQIDDDTMRSNAEVLIVVFNRRWDLFNSIFQVQTWFRSHRGHRETRQK